MYIRLTASVSALTFLFNMILTLTVHLYLLLSK